MKFLITPLLILFASTAFCNDAEDAVLEFFYLSARACAEGNPELIKDFIPEDGFTLIDHTTADSKEIRIPKADALLHQTTAITDLLKSGKYSSVTLPTSIDVTGENITVTAQMIEVSLLPDKKVAARSKIVSHYSFSDGQLKLLRSEMMAHDRFPLAQDVEQGAAANP